MRTYVSLYARILYGTSGHPWKWLTKTYVSFGTTGDYVNMLEEQGFQNVRGNVVFPGMVTIWQGKK